MIRLCEKSGDKQGMKDWYEQWFLSYPDFDLFKQNKLFKAMKKHAPAELIPVYRALALNNISEKKRPAYVRAARWMKELKEVCGFSGNEEIWAAFHGKIMTDFRRFRSLMEEIKAAGLGQP